MPVGVTNEYSSVDLGDNHADEPPAGYDGFCDVEVNGETCGKPGYLRSGPGPYSFIHDEHRDIRTFNFGYLLWIAILLPVLVLVWWILF